MTGKNIFLDNKKIKNYNFYKNNKLFKIDDIDVGKVLVSKKESYGTNKSSKYFSGHSDNDNIKALCIRLAQGFDYVKHFERNKSVSFKVIDNKLLKKYTKIRKKISTLVA